MDTSFPAGAGCPESARPGVFSRAPAVSLLSGPFKARPLRTTQCFLPDPLMGPLGRQRLPQNSSIETGPVQCEKMLNRVGLCANSWQHDEVKSLSFVAPDAVGGNAEPSSRKSRSSRDWGLARCPVSSATIPVLLAAWGPAVGSCFLNKAHSVRL